MRTGPPFELSVKLLLRNSIGPHKKGTFRNVSKQKRRRNQTWGAGAHQRVFYIRVSLFKDPNKGEKAVHGCHYPNLTTALLAQLLSALFVSTDKSLCNLRGEDCDASAGICLSGPDL